MKTKIQIKTIAGSVIFELEAEDNTIKKTLEKAVSGGCDLRCSDLRGCDLSYCDLRCCNLSNCDLRCCNLSNCNLSYCNLRGCDLRNCNLSYCNLRGCDLRGCDLSYCNLREVKNIPKSYINTCSRDMLYVFNLLKHELPALRKFLVEGKVNGTQYKGDCACLIGSLAKECKVDENVLVRSFIPFYELGLHNPCEQWFFQIREGDTPDNNTFSAHAVELIDMVLKQESEGIIRK